METVWFRSSCCENAAFSVTSTCLLTPNFTTVLANSCIAAHLPIGMQRGNVSVSLCVLYARPITLQNRGHTIPVTQHPGSLGE